MCQPLSVRMIPLWGWLAMAAVGGILSSSAGVRGGEDRVPSGPRHAIPPAISRNHPQLTLAGARYLILYAEKKAAELKAAENIAVVDAGGHLIAFARMDGARPASVQTALTKAVAAAMTRKPTGPVRRSPPADPDLLLNLSLQTASGGRMTALPGGLPITVDGEVVGAVGVGGGSGEQDQHVAQAGIDALADLIKAGRR